MSAMVARRNDPGFWEPPIRWQRIQTPRKPPCDDCIVAIHDHRDDTDWRIEHPIRRAPWRRRAGESVTVVCLPHRAEWLAAEVARGSFRGYRL